MNDEASNILLMLCFPLICVAICAAMDVGSLLLRRRKPSLFPGGSARLYWAIMIASLLRSAIFSLFFVPALALEGQVLAVYAATQIEAAIGMVLPALFAAVFATRLERHVFETLESGLLRDRARFLAPNGVVGSKAEQ